MCSSQSCKAAKLIGQPGCDYIVSWLALQAARPAHRRVRMASGIQQAAVVRAGGGAAAHLCRRTQVWRPGLFATSDETWSSTGTAPPARSLRQPRHMCCASAAGARAAGGRRRVGQPVRRAALHAPGAARCSRVAAIAAWTCVHACVRCVGACITMKRRRTEGWAHRLAVGGFVDIQHSLSQPGGARCLQSGALCAAVSCKRGERQ